MGAGIYTLRLVQKEQENNPPIFLHCTSQLSVAQFLGLCVSFLVFLRTTKQSLFFFQRADLTFAQSTRQQEAQTFPFPSLCEISSHPSAKGQHKGWDREGELRQTSQQDKVQAHGTTALPSITPNAPPSERCYSFPSPSCTLLPRGPGTAGTTGQAALGSADTARASLAQGSLTCSWAEAHLRALCSHLIKCLLTFSRRFDIPGRASPDKDYKKNVSLL